MPDRRPWSAKFGFPSLSYINFGKIVLRSGKFQLLFYSLGPSDAIWRWRFWSMLVQVMACCLTAPSHYLTQCWSSVRSCGIHLRKLQGSALSFLAGCPKSHFLDWYRNFLVYWYLKVDNQVVNSTCPKDKLGWIWRADDPYCRTLNYHKKIWRYQ